MTGTKPVFRHVVNCLIACRHLNCNVVIGDEESDRKTISCGQLIESISINTVAHLKLHWALKHPEVMG
jgi:hypothetical protein